MQEVKELPACLAETTLTLMGEKNIRKHNSSCEKLCFSIYHTNSTFMASCSANTASIAFLFININNPSNHIMNLRFLV